MNGSCPIIGAMTRAGFTSAVAAHQPRRISGNAQNIATTRPTKPRTSQSVTTQSPNNGYSNDAVNHGRNPYGKAKAWPCPMTGIRNGSPSPLQSWSLTHQTWP